jgi:hypothetical protein
MLGFDFGYWEEHLSTPDFPAAEREFARREAAMLGREGE